MKIRKVLSTFFVSSMLFAFTAMSVKAMETGWNQVNGEWVYVNEDGSNATGWLKKDGCWYFFNEDGTMHTGWMADGDHWYYMGPSGVMQTGSVIEIEGSTYYMKSNGLMAKDFVKDGIEYDANGVGTPIEENGSVVYDGTELPEVIEGNLYITDEFDEVALEGITVTGKIIIQSEKQIPVSVSLKGVTAGEIVLQARNSEVEIDKESEVKTVVVEESAMITGKGSVETLEVQSSATKETVIDVKADEVSINTYGTVVIESKVGSVTVDNNTDLVVNAKVGTVTITENANESTIEIADGKTVGTVVADAPVSIDGKGTVDKIEANVDGVTTGKDTYVNEVEGGEGVENTPTVNEKPVYVPVPNDYPVAKVTKDGPQSVLLYDSKTSSNPEGDYIDLQASFTFETTESAEEAQNSKYRYWHADFVVYANKEVAANSVALAGQYDLFNDVTNKEGWVVLQADTTIPANEEIRLLQLMGVTGNYEELCNYIPVFKCGVAGLDDSVAGTTLSVELRLFETKDPSETESNTHNEETGKYITIGTYTHKFK